MMNNEDEHYVVRRHASLQLEELLSYRSRDRVLVILGVDDATLDGLLSGTLGWPEEVWGKFQRALVSLSTVGHPVEVDDVALGNAERTEIDPDDETEVRPDRGTCVDGEPDGVVPGVVEPDVSMGPDDRLEDQDVIESAPSVPWQVRDLIVSRLFRSGVPDHKQLAGLLLLLGQEMAIIWKLGESPTEPGVPCDAERLRAEFLERGKMSSIVRSELASMHGGLRGFRSLLLGKGRVNIKKLHVELIAEARAMGPGYRPVLPFTLLDPHDLATVVLSVKTYLSWYRRNP